MEEIITSEWLKIPKENAPLLFRKTIGTDAEWHKGIMAILKFSRKPNVWFLKIEGMSGEAHGEILAKSEEEAKQIADEKILDGLEKEHLRATFHLESFEKSLLFPAPNPKDEKGS